MRIQVEWGTGNERKTQERIDDVLRASSDTCFLLLGDNKQARAFSRYLKTRCTIPSRQACHILLLCIETGRHCHSHLLSDRCCAGNPLWQAATSGRTHWETALRLKISPSHLMPARRTGKCVWRPLALFFISLWRTQPLHKHSLHDALSDCDRQLLTRFKCAEVTHTHRNVCTNCTGHAEKHFFLIRVDEWTHRATHRHPFVRLTGTQTNMIMNVNRDPKAESKQKATVFPHLSATGCSEQTNMFVSLWSVSSIYACCATKLDCTNGLSADAGQTTEQTHVKHKANNAKQLMPNALALIQRQTQSLHWQEEGTEAHL